MYFACTACHQNFNYIPITKELNERKKLIPNKMGYVGTGFVGSCPVSYATTLLQSGRDPTTLIPTYSEQKFYTRAIENDFVGCIIQASTCMTEALG